jgi:pimeloyl-ACP methyl ester carboxylesterase
MGAYGYALYNPNQMRSIFSVVLTASLAAVLPAATVDGIKIHSSVMGKGQKTIIFVHGWTCDESTWNAQVPALCKEYRVITLDLPGHGRSGSPKDDRLGMDLFARSVEAVRQEALSERIVLVGHSMGTRVLIQYARLYPQHTAAMVFVDGMVSPPESAGSGFRSPDPSDLTGPEGLRAREIMIRSMFSASTTPEIQKHILSMMLAAPESIAVSAIQATLDPVNWKGDVFTEPVLGVYSDHSRSNDREYMRTHFPQMEYEEISGTGHFLMLEKPEEFNRLLLGFLHKQRF